MRGVLLVVLAVVLGGCGGPSLSGKQKDEASAIAYQAAFRSIDDSSKIDELETRVAELEQKVDDLEGRLDDAGID